MDVLVGLTCRLLDVEGWDGDCSVRRSESGCGGQVWHREEVQRENNSIVAIYVEL